MTADKSLSISLEATLHRALTDTLESIAAQFGLRVNSMQVAWLDNTTLAKTEYKVLSLTLSSTSGPTQGESHD